MPPPCCQFKRHGGDANASSPSPRNALVQRLARSAAALGANQPERALADLDPLTRELANPAVQATLQAPDSRATPQQALRAQRVVATGLRAKAHTRLGQLNEAALALEERRELLAAQLDETDRDEDLRALAEQPEREAAWRACLAWFEVYLALGEGESLSAASGKAASQ